MTYAKTHKKRRNVESGFTLIELLIGIAIIGLILAVAGPRAYNMWQQAKKNRMERDLKAIKGGIDLFNMQMGRKPETKTELFKKPRDPKAAYKWMEGGYLKGKKWPRDPWGNPYVYKKERDGENPFTLYSKGPTGKGRISIWMLEEIE